MTVTADSPFKSQPRTRRETFKRVLADVGSPWAAKAGALYDLIVSHGHDPAIWLAICGREHSFGTNPDSVLHRNNTNSWTNARSIRHPDIEGEIIIDPVRDSQYVRYRSVEDSLIDGMYRVDEPGYVYQRRFGPDMTIRECLSVWTESGGAAYTAYALARMNDWEGAAVDAQIPGFKWEPADSDHYDRGRIARIRGGAQHYTAGTNSLGWLTKTSMPPVSANFLVKHNPTMEDRGWQMVSIEDTPWTTAFANPYTVSIEYEQLPGQPIPDIAYAVLARSWKEIAEYVKKHNLGEIAPDRSGLRGHNEWVENPRLICPDGVFVDRIADEWRALLQVPEPVEALYLPANPFGEIPVVLGFRALYLEQGAKKFPDDPVIGGLSLFGYAEGEEYPTVFGSCQLFERVIFKWFRNARKPWDLVIAHRAEPIPERAA